MSQLFTSGGQSIYWRFSFSISHSNEYLGLISIRINWFDLAVQGTLKNLLQHHSLKASILRCSAFFMVQSSQLLMTTRKTVALTYRPLSACFLTYCLSLSLLYSKEQESFNFMPAVTICIDFGAQENKVCLCFHLSPHLFGMKVGLDAMILVF